MATGVELATAWVRVVPSVEGIQGAVAKEFGPVEDQAEKTGKKAGAKLSTGMKAAITVASAFIVGTLANVAKDAVASLARIEALNVQTAAAIASTGGAANVSAEHVETLAGTLEALTATEAEFIQENANLLLTFKNVRNEAGEGNDVFDQTIAAFVDMNRANPAATMTMLAKAMNDPVAGLSALARVGVQFNDEQQDMIKGMVEAGDTMGAQKQILAELNSQYGGSGAAYMKTYAGQMTMLEHNFGTLTETIMTAVMPALSWLAETGNTVMTWLMENEGVLTALAVTVGVFTFAILALNVAMWASSVATWAANAAFLANPITWIVLAVVALIAAIVLLALNWDAVVAWIEDVWGGFVGWLTDIMEAVATWWNDLWDGIFSWAEDLWHGFVQWVIDTFMGFYNFMVGIGKNITAWWDGLWSGFGKFVDDAWKSIVNVIIGGLNWVIGMINDFLSGLNAMGSFISDITGGAIDINIGLLPKLPGLADGGTVLGAGSVLVGERGPEILHLPAGARVEPLDRDFGGIRRGDRLVVEIEGTPLTGVVKRVVSDGLSSASSGALTSTLGSR